MPSDMVGGAIDPHSIARVHPTKASTLSKHFLEVGDIVLARRGDIGRCAYVAPQNAGWLCGTGSMKLSLPDGPLSSKYLFYLLQTDSVIGWLNGVSVGATLKNLSAGAVSELPLCFPALELQHSICAILDALEELIENNQQRIRLLEETARILYREWFVNFRYPGHEDVPLVDSELGPIPGDWEICQVDEVMGVVGGGTPSKKEEGYWVDGTIQWYTPSDLTATGSMFASESGLKINELGLAKSSANLFPAGSVMMTSRATIGVLSFSTTEACTNQGFITCVPSERLSGSHIYFWLEAHVPLFLQIGTGATFKELTKSTFRKLPIAVPPVPLEEEFCSLVDPLLQSVLNLLRQQQVLQSSRDLLLPRLVSGDLDISDLDLDLEAVG